MRTMMTVRIPTEQGNKGVKEGGIARVLEATMADIKPEAAFFGSDDGERTAYFFFDLKNQADIPQIAERFFMELHARVDFKPVMNAEDLKTGLSKLR